jgi:hypothetical protein
VKLALEEENPFGPLQLYTGFVAPVVALKEITEPTQAEFVLVVMVGAAGAPGFVIEYGPKFALQPLPSCTCTL